VRLSDHLVLVRGGGHLATGVALRLHLAGFTVLVTELSQPRARRRAAAFAQAVYAGTVAVEGVTARLAADAMSGMAFTVLNDIPVVVDPASEAMSRLHPAIVVDARRPLPPLASVLPGGLLLIGLGAGFTPGVDCHAVVDTARGPHLGRVYWEFPVSAAESAPEPGLSLLRAPAEGAFLAHAALDAVLPAGAAIGEVAGQLVLAPHDGRVCGLLADSLPVAAGDPVAELDADGSRAHGYLVSDRARAVGGGVLEALLSGLSLWLPPEDPDLGLP
jgi:xanthine dehydrogenase accessory factor